MKSLCILFLLTFFGIHAMAQSDSSNLNLGLGIGLDYGGFGGRITFMPIKSIGLFGALGYNLGGVGVNAGLQVKFPSEKRVSGFITGMYGYNGVIVIIGAPSETRIYYGPTFGGGIEIKLGKKRFNFLNIELLIPIRSPAFHDKIVELNRRGIEISEPSPLTFSIGYHFIL